MREIRLALAILALPLFWVGAAQAQEQPQAPGGGAVATVTVEAEAAQDEVVCRAEPRAASRLQTRARVCKTRREWREFDERAAVAAASTQNRDRYAPRSDPARPQ